MLWFWRLGFVGPRHPTLCRLSGCRPELASRKPVQLVQLRRMALAPFTERSQHRLQAQSELRRRVVDPRRHLAENLAMDETVFLQFPKLLDQHLLAHVRDLPLQFGESLRAVKQVVQDDGLPTAGDHLQGAFGRQRRQSLRHLRHGYLPVSMARMSV